MIDWPLSPTCVELDVSVDRIKNLLSDCLFERKSIFSLHSSHETMIEEFAVNLTKLSLKLWQFYFP